MITIDPRLFPAVLMTLDVMAAAVWACHSDWRRTIYWIAAAILTATVTF